MAKLMINKNKKEGTIAPEIYGHFSEHLGRCIYEGLYVGENSEIPNVNGMRTDVVEALKEIKIPVLRWPGGCFADEYHWKDGIGPKENRKKMINTHWGGVVEDNSFGTHEFFELCRQLGCKTYINGNLGSGTVQEMSEWVEYMTFNGVSPMADLRKKNGHEEPWTIDYFGVGNENWGCGGNMRPQYYADEYRRYQTYVRNYDPQKPIQKICGGANVDDYDWTRKVLETTHDHTAPEFHGFMDGLSLHYYVHPEGWEIKGSATDFDEEVWYKTLKKALYMETLVERHGKIMDQYDPDKKIGMIVDEWGCWFTVEPGTNPGFLYQQNTVRDALVAGITLNIFNKHCDRVKMANLAIVAGYSVNGVARLHTEILEKQELRDFYELFPEKFNNKTNGITQRRFLAHGNPLLADWVTKHVGKDWITSLAKVEDLTKYATDPKAQQEFLEIKKQNKIRLAKYIKEHNGIEVDPNSIFDVQVKRLHEYKRQLMNILHVMYLYNQIKANPGMDFYPRTFIFGAKAAAGYRRAKLTIKLINSVADVVNNDASINGKLKVVFIEDYRVSNAELIFAAADVSEQISTASKEASGTGNMKFMLNGAVTLGTMDGANVEIVEEVGKENAFIFGLSAEEVMKYEKDGGYYPMDIYNSNPKVKKVLDQLVDGTYSNGDKELFRDLYDSLVMKDVYFTLKDFDSYADAQKRVEEAYRDQQKWSKMAMLNTACSGKFTSDRTIEEYVRDIWHLEKVEVPSGQDLFD